MKNLLLYCVALLLFVVSCKNAGITRSDEDGMVVKTVSLTSQRTIDASDIVVPEGYKIEAVNAGLTYPVDITFDEEGNYYLAEAGGHTYGTKPPKAPEARILKVCQIKP